MCISGAERARTRAGARARARVRAPQPLPLPLQARRIQWTTKEDQAFLKLGAVSKRLWSVYFKAGRSAPNLRAERIKAARDALGPRAGIARAVGRGR